MCAILCLFSALTRRVGALQISTIIIIRQRQETDRQTNRQRQRDRQQTDRDRETGNRQTETRGLEGGVVEGGGGAWRLIEEGWTLCDDLHRLYPPVKSVDLELVRVLDFPPHQLIR